MRRIVPAALILSLILAFPMLALTQDHGHPIAMPDTLKWVDPPTFPGAKLAMVQGDPGKEGLFVYRVQFPANYKVAPHKHKASENVTVLSGAFFIGAGERFDQGSAKEMPAGAFVSIPPEHAHFAYAGAQGTLVQVHGVGPTDIRFINPADDPRKK
jgi:quercetin dioxygenase-like cupin family protein